MNLCDNGHSEVCYQKRNCPACRLLEKIKELEVELEDSKARED